MEIKTYSFDLTGYQEQKKHPYGNDWPVVYLIYNSDTLYVGETTSAANRMNQHLNNKNKQKANLKYIKVIYDDTFNKSVILDYEQKLIKCCKADKTFAKVLNANDGQSDSHNYYQRPNYSSHFYTIWNELQQQGIVKKSLDVIANDNIFKYSPYTSLTPEQGEIQINVLNDIYDKLINNKKGVSLVDGCAGTGKTILGISLINNLVNAINIDETELTTEQKNEPLNAARLRIKHFAEHVRPIRVGLVFPMTGIRSVIEKVFQECGNSLNKKLVMNPYQIKNNNYDVIIVDESHRLSRRKNLTNYNDFDKTCKYYGLDCQKANQLDCVLKGSKYTVLFYDKDQSIKSADIPYNEFQQSLKTFGGDVSNFKLESQMRCAGGSAYIDYVKQIMNCSNPHFTSIANYDFKIFDDVDSLIQSIRSLDGNFNNLCKTVAGFAWEWKTKPKSLSVPDNLDRYNELVHKGEYDIDIKGNHYIWNLTTSNWISRKDSRYTIGCIHTTQGFDLNYVGVIFGEEIDYNPITNKIEVDLHKFKDTKVKADCDPQVVKDYIINTYTTILARGIKGCYVYACNKNLQEYLKQFIQLADPSNLKAQLNIQNNYDYIFRNS